MTFDPNQPRDPHGKWEGAGHTTAEASQVQAAKTANGRSAIEGLPQKPIKIGDAYYTPGPNAAIQDAAKAYMAKAGLTYEPPAAYIKADPENATKIAQAFEAMGHTPDDPATKASYEAMAKEVQAQWEALKATGLKVDWIPPGQPDPYGVSPRLAELDVSEHNHWWGFPTDSGFGDGSAEAKAAMKDNPLLQPTGETIGGRKVLVNDVFRIVHDMFGHIKEGNGFRADGEDNAWRSHVAMFSDAAKGAMTSETRGQNSWVNFGPYAAHNKHASGADTHYAPQKIGLMPEWTRKTH